MRDRFDHTLERKHDTKPGHDVVVAQRFGIVTGPGRCREWSSTDKARIIVESLTPGANVSEVARRNGLSPQQLFGWRRKARELFVDDRGEARAACSALQPSPPESAPTAHSVATSQPRSAVPTFVPAFVPIVVAVSGSAPTPDQAIAAQRTSESRTGPIGVIEIVIGHNVVRVVGRVDADTLQAVIEIIRRSACS